MRLKKVSLICSAVAQTFNNSQAHYHKLSHFSVSVIRLRLLFTNYLNDAVKYSYFSNGNSL